jgi:hypothetical protein
MELFASRVEPPDELRGASIKSAAVWKDTRIEDEYARGDSPSDIPLGSRFRVRPADITKSGTIYTVLMETLNKCGNCENNFLWSKSTASLKMSYCSTLCEQRGLGFSLEALERNKYERISRVPNIVIVTSDDFVDIEKIIMESKKQSNNDDQDLVTV